MDESAMFLIFGESNVWVTVCLYIGMYWAVLLNFLDRIQAGPMHMDWLFELKLHQPLLVRIPRKDFDY